LNNYTYYETYIIDTTVECSENDVSRRE
jgi:hypothetical protein